MSFAKELFPRFRRQSRGGILPLFTSPPSRSVDEHDLAELSPRPDEALLVNGFSDTPPNGGSSAMRNRGNSAQAHYNKGKNVKMNASVSFQEPPRSPSGSGYGFYEDERSEQGSRQYDEYLEERSSLPVPVPGIWRPSFLREPRDLHIDSAGPHQSFFESMFNPRPALTERASSTKVDQTFKIIERRERQMQRELQQLLDAQDYALEKHLANSSSSTLEEPPSDLVVPVRQPKKRHLSKREARLGILRCMTQLSDLKNEEESYIATALAERKAALSRLRNLSNKRNAVIAEMKAIESDHDQPQKDDIGKMEQRHREVCEGILELEEKLRELRRTKNKLESRIAEAKNAREAELSGYRGALSECDRRIRDVMDYPGVAVLEVEGLMAHDADLKALLGQHLSGLEFLSLRPERRTAPMAKDWWDGEVHVLELRKMSVDKERGALDEGTQLWQDVLDRLEEHDRHLKLTFDKLSRYSQQQTSTSGFDALAKDLKEQFELCRETTKGLEDLHDYAAEKGWKLLVTALSAEINYLHRLKEQLGDTLQVVGLEDDVATTPKGRTSSGASRDEDDLLGVNDARDSRDHLTGSVVRRWDRTNDLHQISSDDDAATSLGFRQEAHIETDEDDEHNEVPREFLSMHSPTPRPVSNGIDREGGGGESRHWEHEDITAGVEEEDHRPVRRDSRDSSANEVPPDLLAESHHVLLD
ncbi:hypothetical protein F5Y17DRAFT_443223 [Xylariaceae sp. FL0594]|nr:hypothetical protein F5Y17DRAFT_443223 [Xylariaceae sp. FL0594]